MKSFVKQLVQKFVLSYTHVALNPNQITHTSIKIQS